ncbi:MAG: AAA family ATPase [Chitinophagales bacterium]
MTIIGITGTIGAGKGTIVDYLVSQHQYRHFSVRGFLTRLIEERKMPLNRDSMVQVANELRAAHSPSYIVEQLLEDAMQSGANCIIESIRTVGEIQALRAHAGSFYLFAVDADAPLRYQRVVARASETDNISFETFLENESREMTSADPNKQNLAACQQLADFQFTNNGSFTDLYGQVENILQQINAV